MNSRIYSADPEDRRQLASDLRDNVSSDALDALLILLGDSDWRVRKTAVESITAREDIHSALGRLIEQLGSEDNAGLRNSSSETLQLLGMVSVAPLTEKLKKTDDPDMAIAVLNLLGSIGDCSEIDVVIKETKNKNKNVAASAISCIGNLRIRKASNDLMVFLDSDDSWLSFHSIEALGKLGETRAVPKLKELFKTGRLRRCILDSFSEIGGNEVVEFLALEISVMEKLDWDLLKAFHKLYVKSSSIPSAIPSDSRIRGLFTCSFPGKLVTQMIHESDSKPVETRLCIIEMLSWMKGSEIAEYLVQSLSDIELRQCAKKCLLKHPDVAEPLIKAISEPSDDMHLIQIIDVLGVLKIKDSLQLLLPLISSENPEVRLSVAGALKEIADNGVFDALLELLLDSESEVQKEASGAILNILQKTDNSAEHINMLIDLMKSDDHNVRKGVINIIAEVEGVKAKDQLILASKDESSDVRKTAVRLMGKIGDEVFSGAISAALSDESGEVREVAVRTLSKISIPRADEILKALLDDDDMWVRAESAECIGKLKLNSESMEKRLYKTFKKDLPLVKIAAVKSIGSCNGKNALDIIREAFNSDEEEIRIAAVEALGLMCDADAEEMLLEIIGNSNWKISSSAVLSLSRYKDKKKIEGSIISLLNTNTSTSTVSAVMKVLTEMKSERAVHEAVELLKKGHARKDVEEYLVAIGKIDISVLKNESLKHSLSDVRPLFNIIEKLEDCED